MAVRVYAYNAGSRSARNLADALNGRVLRREGSVWRPRQGDTVINWGSSTIPNTLVGTPILNNAHAVHVSGNKLEFFDANARAANPARMPEYTTDRAVAQAWPIAVSRTVLTGHSGRGIIISDTGVGDVVPEAPLYTKYVKKQQEFRVHIVRGEIIDTQRKIRDPAREPTNWQVRSHDNGFIYVRTGFVVPADVHEQARRAFVASGLDFGAVDVIVNRDGLAYVLEINTAPGLEGQTVQNYADAFRRIV